MRTTIGSFVIAVFMLAAVPAVAGGGNWIDYENQYNGVGSSVHISAQFNTSNEAKDRAEAPYYLYLERVTGPNFEWDLPTVGDSDVYRVAEVTIDWANESASWGIPMSATFEVPALERGRYAMSICDFECEHIPGANLNPVMTTGYFRIVDTAA